MVHFIQPGISLTSLILDLIGLTSLILDLIEALILTGNVRDMHRPYTYQREDAAIRYQLLLKIYYYVGYCHRQTEAEYCALVVNGSYLSINST